MSNLESGLRKDERYALRHAHWVELLTEIQSQEEALRLGGGAARQEKHRRRGKMTARDRIAALADPETELLELGLWVAHGFYEEFGGAPAAGTVTGIISIHGRQVVVVANDATVKAGAWFPLTCKKILRAQEIALENRLPIVYLVDSAGVFLPPAGGDLSRQGALRPRLLQQCPTLGGGNLPVRGDRLR